MSTVPLSAGEDAVDVTEGRFEDSLPNELEVLKEETAIVELTATGSLRAEEVVAAVEVGVRLDNGRVEVPPVDPVALLEPFVSAPAGQTAGPGKS